MAAIPIYFALIDPMVTAASRRIARRYRIGRHFSVNQIDSTIKLGLATASQGFFTCAVLFGAEVNPGFLTMHVDPILLVYAVPLGLGEAAVASWLCYAAIRVMIVTAPERSLLTQDELLVVSRAGWMRQFKHTSEIFPAPVLLAASSVYIAAEEILFRGVVMTSAGDLGATWAFFESLALFMVVQLFPLGSWRASVFPLIGALVIGVTHGVLFLAIPSVWPLIIAHIVSFWVTAKSL